MSTNRKFCSQCGHKLSGDHRFCVECGAQVGEVKTRGQKSMMPGKETLIVLGVAALAAAVFFTFKAPAPIPVAENQLSTNGNPQQLSMAMIDALPQDYGTLVQMGNQYMDQMNFAVAAELYSRALAIDGSSSDVRTDYGACLHGMGMPERAIEEFKKVIKADPSHAIAHFNTGIVYHQLGNPDSAAVYYRHYLDREPNGRASESAKAALKELER